MFKGLESGLEFPEDVHVIQHDSVVLVDVVDLELLKSYHLVCEVIDRVGDAVEEGAISSGSFHQCDGGWCEVVLCSLGGRGGGWGKGLELWVIGEEGGGLDSISNGPDMFLESG